MTTSGFNRSLKRVLVHEGGKVDDPRDPGGRTNQGVTQKVFDAYLRSAGKKPRDVYSMTNAERDAIYRRRYWDVVGGDKLPAGVDYVVFDGAVNSGPVQSLKWLQRALGTRYTGKLDGQGGMMTFDAIEDFPDHKKLVDLICDRRMAFLLALTTFKVFGKGWKSRVDSVRATGQAWASGNKEPPGDHIPKAQAKANVEDAQPMPVMAVADMGSSAGATTAGAGYGASELIDQTKNSLSDFWYIEVIQKILLGLTVAGVTLMVGGIGYRWLAARRKAKLKDALDLEVAPMRGDPPVTVDA